MGASNDLHVPTGFGALTRGTGAGGARRTPGKQQARAKAANVNNTPSSGKRGPDRESAWLKKYGNGAQMAASAASRACLRQPKLKRHPKRPRTIMTSSAPLSAMAALALSQSGMGATSFPLCSAARVCCLNQLSPKTKLSPAHKRRVMVAPGSETASSIASLHSELYRRA